MNRQPPGWSAYPLYFHRDLVSVCPSACLSVYPQAPLALQRNHDSRTYGDLLEAWQQIQIEGRGMARGAPSQALSQTEDTEVGGFGPVLPNTNRPLQVGGYGAAVVSNA